MPQLPADEIKRRAELLRALDKELRESFAASFIGTEQTVFIEEHKEGQTRGITSNFQTVLIENAPQNLHGLVRVKIVRAQNNLCYGAL